jgi:DNA-binding transcriptional MerR regulator
MSRHKPVHDPAEWHSASKAARLSGLSLPMVNYLCRSQIVEPSCNCPRGHGRRRHYSFADVVALRLIARLSQFGVSPTRLKGAWKGLRKHHPEITLTSLPASHIATDGENLILCQPGESVERLVDGQMAFAFVVELAPLQKEVARALRRA